MSVQVSAGQRLDKGGTVRWMVQDDLAFSERSERRQGSERPVAPRAADAGLRDRLVAGDESALAELYDLHSPLVYGLARRVTGDDAIAQDITQDVFSYLWEHADRVDLHRGSIRSFLGVITHRRAVDACRRESRLRHHTAREASLLVEVRDDIVALDDRADQDHRVRALRSALERLSAEQREALMLAYFGGRTYRQVAVELDIPEGTAKSRLRLALARLRELLEPEMLPSWS